MQITVTNHIIALAGMLDTNSAPDFEQTIQTILATPQDITLDLSEMTYTSSQGLRLFLALQKGLSANGRHLTLRGVQPAVMEVLRMTGFTNLLTIEN